MPPGNISFNDESNFHIKSRVILGAPETPKMISFLTSKGIVKNEKDGKTLLIVAAGIFFAASIVVLLVFNTDLFKKSSLSNDEIKANIERFNQIKKNAKKNVIQ